MERMSGPNHKVLVINRKKIGFWHIKEFLTNELEIKKSNCSLSFRPACVLSAKELCRSIHQKQTAQMLSAHHAHHGGGAVQRTHPQFKKGTY